MDKNWLKNMEQCQKYIKIIVFPQGYIGSKLQNSK